MLLLPSHLLAPYPAPEQRDRELYSLAGRLGAEIHTYGQSVEGRPLLALHVPATHPSPRSIFICANIHGVEFIGNRVAHSFLEHLSSDPGGLRGQAHIWVAPCLNPDGYARTWQLGGDAPLGELRKNARGVDLNRNFPLPWGAAPRSVPFAGSRARSAATYRGEAPASEPEVQHLLHLLRQVRPHAGLNLHSCMGTLIPPRVLHWIDHRQYASLARSFQAGQGKGWRYRRLAFPPLDVFTGEQEDHQHHVLRCWTTCVEVFPLRAALWQGGATTFWRFNPRTPAPWIQQDVQGMVRWFLHALSLPPPPARAQAEVVRSVW